MAGVSNSTSGLSAQRVCLYFFEEQIIKACAFYANRAGERSILMLMRASSLITVSGDKVSVSKILCVGSQFFLAAAVPRRSLGFGCDCCVLYRCSFAGKQAVGGKNNDNGQDYGQKQALHFLTH